MGRLRRSIRRFRIGQVSVYQHRRSWWLYYREAHRPVRKRAGEVLDEAKSLAAQVNAQLALAVPTQLSFTPVSVSDLRRLFLEHYEHVLAVSLATLDRYRTATLHLENFVNQGAGSLPAHQINAERFVAYLRTIEVSPNGHPNSAKRRLLDKGVLFVLETVRSMYNFALKRRHLPPYTANPFAELQIKRLRNNTAKTIFVFSPSDELEFMRAADDWAFPIHFTLAKTGLRIGELTHLLIEDLDLDGGWLHVRNKTALGWRIKTGRERRVPLIPELNSVLRCAIGSRSSGPVFRRKRFFHGSSPPLDGNQSALEAATLARVATLPSPRSRQQQRRITLQVWRDAGAITGDEVRNSFLRIMRSIGRPSATCPKSWRHTFATLMQDANVDPLVRQNTLGHQTASGGLGMTANYTHTRPQTLRCQVEAALRLWPDALEFAQSWVDKRIS